MMLEITVQKVMNSEQFFYKSVLYKSYKLLKINNQLATYLLL